MASSSSSSSTRPWKYDVFLSFRGPDTRIGIANEIYGRLNGGGIKVFMDEADLQVGDVISATLIQAIKDSRFAIVILSQNYASSTWCLEELREICLSIEDERILPLFYEVDPTDVRYQKSSFEEAFLKHKGRHESEKVEQWRAALNRVAHISGWTTNKLKTYDELVGKIVEDMRSKVPLDPIESTGDFQVYAATKEAIRKVLEALTDDKITTVGVHGMGGVGKTSMVRHVAAQACKNGTCNRWIIASVSQNIVLENIQDTLADLLRFKFESKTVDGRAAELHKEILRKEKVLVILDDVWDEIVLSEIGIPNSKELQTRNSKVLLTTRKFNVCVAMKCTAEHGQVIPLNILSKEDAFTLFWRNAGKIESTFDKVARKVAEECKGLPIALITVAKALGGEDLKEWEKAALLLEKSQYANPNHEEQKLNAFNCIRLSYNYLKKEQRVCFLLCCMFPEDHEIKIEDLFRYTIGKRLFQDAETMEEARGKLVSVVRYLKNSSLLLDGRLKGYVKMHDVIRDTAIQIAESEDGHRFFVKAGCGFKGWPPRGLHKGCTAISLMNSKIDTLPEEELGCPNLQILLLNGNPELSEIPEKLFQNLKELRVLDLRNTRISVLPQSISLLTNLQALYLDRRMKLDDISMVGKKKLEILSVRDCSAGQLWREVGDLTNLRILDVDCSTSICRVIIPSKVISKLHKLEELYLICCGFENRWSEAEREDGWCEAESEDGGCEAESEDGRSEAESEDGGYEAESEDGRSEAESEDESEDGRSEAESEDGGCEAESEDGRSEAESEDGRSEAESEDGGCEAESEDESEDGRSEAESEDGRYEAERPTEETNIIRVDELAGLSNLKILRVCLTDQSFIPEHVGAAPDWDYFCISIFGRGSKSSLTGPSGFGREYPNSRLLLLNDASISTLPDWFINAVTKKTEKLEYCCRDGIIDIVKEYDHGRLHKLKHLEVEGYSFGDGYVIVSLRRLMNTTRRVETGPVFENLEELHVKDLYHLEELLIGELPPGSFSNLKVFHLRNAYRLKNVSKFVQRLPNLENLDFNGMKKLEYVFGCEGFEPEQSKLREMHLWNQRALRSICNASNGPSPRAMFRSLKTLTVANCDWLESLFASDVAQCLVQLEDLLVEDCPLFKRVMEAANKDKTVLPKLKNLLFGNLPMLYGSSATNDDIECPSLEHLFVEDCAHISFSTDEDHNQLSSSASDYFGSKYPVQLHDRHFFDFLKMREGGRYSSDTAFSSKDLDRFRFLSEYFRNLN